LDIVYLVIGIVGGAANILVVTGAISRLEHRLTRTEIHLVHILNNLSIKVKESEMDLGG